MMFDDDEEDIHKLRENRHNLLLTEALPHTHMQRHILDSNKLRQTG